MNLSQFAARISDIGRQIETNSVQVMKEVALVVDQAVVSATPVDTGRAKTNWITELNQPSSRTTDIADPTGGSAISQARATIARAGAGSVIHITNNLPYIQRLNDGYSAQASAGFVEQAIQVGVDAVRRARGLFR